MWNGICPVSYTHLDVYKRQLYCALIGYIWYEAPAEEMNFTTLLELIALLQGCALDLSGIRQHHEIYLSDARRCKAENLKTVIRLPIRQPPKCAN